MLSLIDNQSMNIRQKIFKNVLFILYIFCLTFTLVIFGLHLFFNHQLNIFVSLKTAGGTSLVYFLMVLMKGLSSIKIREEIIGETKKFSKITNFFSQVFIYLIIVLTVYSFVYLQKI